MTETILTFDDGHHRVKKKIQINQIHIIAVISISWTIIGKIVKQIPCYVQNLDISQNVVVSLDKTSLRDLRVISLVQLNASSNYISVIDEEAFLGHSKLQTVDRSSNSLNIIEPKSCIHIPSLETLSLFSNQDLILPEDGPSLYSKSLRVLNL